MLTKSILLLATAALSVASPLRRQKGPCKPNPPPGSVIPQLPVTNAGDELVLPPDGQVLKLIALGHGIQNYTCTLPAATEAEPEPKLTATANGALAVLYDVTDYYPGMSAKSLHSVDAFNQMTIPVLQMLDLPLNIDTSAASETSLPATSSPFPEPADITVKKDVYPFVGRHYFSAAGDPTFDLLDRAGLLAVVKKDDSVPAPATAYKGPMGTGAVAWLLLSDKGSSEGVQFVYRVNTAGGVAQQCVNQGDKGSVSYTAHYWFYGPESS